MHRWVALHTPYILVYPLLDNSGEVGPTSGAEARLREEGQKENPQEKEANRGSREASRSCCRKGQEGPHGEAERVFLPGAVRGSGEPHALQHGEGGCQV